MAHHVIVGAASLSEFVGLPVHEFGDCGEDATLVCLHAINPVKWPLTPAGLGALDIDEQSQGYAESNGAQNIEHMDAYLTHLGIPHTTYGYATPDVVDKLHAQLRLFLSGVPNSEDPVIVEYQDTGAGFPDDEPAVRFHFNGFAGEDSLQVVGPYVGCYYRFDGDSRTDSQTGLRTSLIPTPWQWIAKAQPIAYIVVHRVPTVAQATRLENMVIDDTGDTQDTVDQAPASEPVVHVVRSEDLMGGWAGVAALHGVSLADLVAANAAVYPDPDVMRTEQVLVIPQTTGN